MPIGVLLLQLGTPDAPTADAVRQYLRQFLGDPRVIEAPRLLWWFILNFKILRKRPAQSAIKYQRIWDPHTGSPLLHYTRRQTEALQKVMPEDFVVRFAMRYGNPPIPQVVREMIEAGIERLIVLPLYPQYSATTTGSALDGLFKALMNERRMPALRVVPPYYAHPAYIDALAGIIREEQARLDWAPEHYLLSFHGIPLSYVQKGDPYADHVGQTTRLLVERLGWRDGTWTQCYQSVFGKAEWLKPYTEPTLRELTERGIRRIFIATPGFTADCLETIDEIGYECREVFQHAGGVEMHRAACLNDHAQWIEAMRQLMLNEAQGWLST